jgi:hypothetical protein
MRPDMFKVIVERPRRGRMSTGGSDYPRGHLKNRWAPDLEAAPRTESMGGTCAHKWLNENLRPLVRFLRANVGRPWDKVRSEIAAQVSCRSALQKHVLDHLRDYVKEDVRVEGRTVVFKGWRGFEPLVSRGTWVRFYVCPRTRLLRLAPVVPRKRPPSASPPDRRILSEERELRRLDGVWYEVIVAPIPGEELPLGGVFDVVERVVVGSPYQTTSESNVLWRTGRYAMSKRQLNAREIARHGLRSTRRL